jgi:hypothetical protein
MLRSSFVAEEAAAPLDQGCVKVYGAFSCSWRERLTLRWRVGHDIDATCCWLVCIAILLG